MTEQERIKSIEYNGGKHLKNFKPENLLGNEIEVNVNDEYMHLTVIGIYEFKQEGSMMRGNNKNISTTMYIPLKNAWNFTHDELIFDATVVAAEGEDAAALSTEIKEYLTSINKPYLEGCALVGIARFHGPLIEE